MNIVQILIEFLINFRNVLKAFIRLQIGLNCKHLQWLEFTLFDQTNNEFDTTQVLEIESS